MKIFIFLLSIFLASCSTMTFTKGKMKKSRNIAYKCHRGEELFFVIKSDEHYKEGRKIFVTEKQFNLFDKINPKDKEEYLLYLKQSGMIMNVYRNNTVDIDIDKELEKQFKREKIIINP